MCGITGFVDINTKNSFGKEIIEKMTDSLQLRGPDQRGTWVDEINGVYLGHRRLSIVDLSSTGNQPMYIDDGSASFIFNGEIYNHIEIGKELVKEFNILFKGHSDSEVLFYALVNWGLEKTLSKIRGMFSFCFYDKSEGKIYLARDKAGEKPLYFGEFNGVWAFGSELKAIKAHPQFKKEINKNAINEYFRLGYIPAPHSIWNGVNKLRPASYIIYDVFNKTISSQISYWDSGFLSRPSSRLYKEDIEKKLHQTLIKAVDEQLVADVPVGSFLSGGVDSSLVVAIAKRDLGKNIKTFSIGFDDDSYDESKYAQEASNILDTNHSDVILRSEDAISVLPKLANIYDEPFGDPSAIPTFIVSKLAKQDVTVVLSGDGADELFAGYSRYHSRKFFYLWTLWKSLKYKKTLSLLSRSFANKKIQLMINASNFHEFYSIYISHWSPPPLKSNISLNNSVTNNFSQNTLNQMTEYDFRYYLPDCILTKLDRASMANSLEGRIPFLDSRVIDIASQINYGMIYSKGQGKVVLKNILENYLPKSFIDRPKQGFGIPLMKWLNNDFYEICEFYLNKKSLSKSGILNEDKILQIWQRLKLGEQKYQQLIWLVLIFQLWVEENL